MSTKSCTAYALSRSPAFVAHHQLFSLMLHTAVGFAVCFAVPVGSVHQDICALCTIAVPGGLIMNTYMVLFALFQASVPFHPMKVAQGGHTE